MTVTGWHTQRRPQNFDGKGDGWLHRVGKVADGRPEIPPKDTYRFLRRRIRRRLRALSSRSCSPFERKNLRFLSSRSIPERCMVVWNRLSRPSPSSPSRNHT